MTQTFLLISICVLAIMSPGPDFFMISRNALRYPLPQALMTTFGVITGCFLYSVGCTLGLVIIITNSVMLFSLIKYLGAVYLVCMGISSFFSSSAPVVVDEKANEARPSVSLWNAYMQGFLCNILNPKLAIFLLSLFTQFISIHATISEKIFVSSVFIIVSAIYWPMLVLILQTKKVRSFFSRAQSVLDKLFGALLVSMGIKIAVSRD